MPTNELNLDDSQMESLQSLVKDMLSKYTAEDRKRTDEESALAQIQSLVDNFESDAQSYMKDNPEYKEYYDKQFPSDMPDGVRHGILSYEKPAWLHHQIMSSGDYGGTADLKDDIYRQVMQLGRFLERLSMEKDKDVVLDKEKTTVTSEGEGELPKYADSNIEEMVVRPMDRKEMLRRRVVTV